jgi:hypothetical protein
MYQCITENVKLLTFVSIFFLPLAFCTSLWSMSDSLFPIHILTYVIISVALATYLIVFNLNALVLLFRTAYESHKASLVTSMKSETGSEYWKSRGESFESFQFRPKAEIAKPTEWLLLGYTLRRCVVWIFSSLGILQVTKVGGGIFKRLRRFGRSSTSEKVGWMLTKLIEVTWLITEVCAGIFNGLRRFGKRSTSDKDQEATAATNP